MKENMHYMNMQKHMIGQNKPPVTRGDASPAGVRVMPNTVMGQPARRKMDTRSSLESLYPKVK